MNKEKEVLHALGIHDWRVYTAVEINKHQNETACMNRRICKICLVVEVELTKGQWEEESPSNAYVIQRIHEKGI